MSGGTKQKYKQFRITCIEDDCLALGSLITGVSVNLDKYKEYASEAENLFIRVDKKYIHAKEYDDINDKLLYRQHEILKLMADSQSCSFSYKDFRKLLEKNKYVTSMLTQEVADILSELLDVRNWTFHNPQSLMVAAKEAAEKSIPDELKGIVQVMPQLNPVLIQKISQYEMIMLVSLILHTEKRIEQFEKVLAGMKADYQEMYNSIRGKSYLVTLQGFSEAVQYVELSRTAGLSDHSSDIAQISMAIQKSKYDGSKEKFKEWVVRFENEKE